MSDPTDGAKTPNGNAPTTNDPAPSRGTSGGSNPPVQSSADWDSTGQAGAWVKESDLVGTAFLLTRVYKRTSGEPAYVFVLDGGRKFSSRMEGTTIGDQISRSGIPPFGRHYTIDKVSSKGPQGYALVLRVLPTGYVAGQPVPSRPTLPTAPTA